MSEPAPSPAPPRPRGRAVAWLLALALLALCAYAAQHWNTARQARERAVEADRQRIATLEERVAALRREQRAQTARAQQAEATNRLLREELIGLGQRAALVEDSVHRLADTSLQAGQALRLDEIELLLSQGEQRLLLAGDLDGARRAYALAAGLLDGIADHDWLDLRQLLAQERAALDALGADPRTAAAAGLAAFAAALPPLPRQAPAVAAQAWWARALSKLVQVRPSAGVAAPADHAAALAALQLELGLAQAAAERRDGPAYRAALARAEAWLLRLWPDSPERARQRAALQALRAQPLEPAVPVLGSTLAQLRRQRGGARIQSVDTTSTPLTRG